MPTLDDNILGTPQFKKDHSGKDEDRKGGKMDGLYFRWQWVQRRRLSTGGSGRWAKPNARTPCQTCEATHAGFYLEVSQFGNTYDADISYNGEVIVHTPFDTTYATRLEGQLAVEVMLVTFLLDGLRKIPQSLVERVQEQT